MVKRIALVTGANRGIGFEVCKQLLKSEFFVLLTSRNSENGMCAVKKLKNQSSDIVFLQLDVTDPNSIKTIYEFVEDKFGRLDVLINNAGAIHDPSMNPPDYENASVFRVGVDILRQSMETNALGAFQMCQTFIPLMQKHNYGRVVNVSSKMGQLHQMGGYWPGYRISKTALNALTRIFSEELKETNILVNSAHPGWVRTEMGGPTARSTVEEGAQTIVYLATLPEGGPSGGFFENKVQIEW